MNEITLPSGTKVPALGQGTWQMGVRPANRSNEIKALQAGLDFGLKLIDTAEMYGEGECEKVVGEAIRGRRNEVFLVSKVYPHNASRDGVKAACERSLKRLATDRIDLYLLHWRGAIPLRDTVEGFLELREAGKIGAFGVSNFAVDDMEELLAIPGGSETNTNQVMYNLCRRGIEWDLLPWQHQNAIPVMAYSPIDKGNIARNRKLATFAERLGATAAQVALAWLLAQPNTIIIPKSSNLDRLRENVAAATITLTDEQRAELDELFPPPRRAQALNRV